jgi:uncharacterized protein YkwD
LRTVLVVVFSHLAFCSAAGVVLPANLSTPAGGTAQTSTGALGIVRMRWLEPQVLAAINDFRRAHGLQLLRPNPALAAAADQHSLSMAEYGFFEHRSLDGSPFWKRIEAAYPKDTGRFWKVGENLAWASPGLNARQALELWLASPSHRENLLSPVWREIGLGAVHGFAGGVYEGRDVTILTADFGVRG